MLVKEFNEKKKYSDVSGVSAIVDSDIKIKMNEYGLYEEIVEKNDDEELSDDVKQVCPYLNSEINEDDISKELYGNIENIKYDSRIGYYESLMIGHVTEGDYRKNGSSGGMATWVLKELIDKGLVDGVVHVKHSTENDGIIFKYGISKTIEEVISGCKTKYYPVEMSEVLELVKSNPGKYAIIGIPSFIMSIRLLQKKDKIFKERIKYTLSIICGHQKSSKYAEAMAWQMGIKPGDLMDIDFRHKLDDRPANIYAVKFTGLINGEMKTFVKPTAELIGHDWGMGYFKQLSSDFVDDVFGETADITFGDAWLPNYQNDSKGNNIIIIRNSDINNLIEQGINEGKLKIDKVDNDIIFKSQESHYRHTREELAYRLWKVEELGQWHPNKRITASNDISYFRKNVQDLRDKISKKSHEIYYTSLKNNDFSYLKNEMKKLNDEYVITYNTIRAKELGPIGMIKKICSKIYLLIKDKLFPKK